MDHLSLHVMVRALDTPDKQDLRKLQLLKDELVSFSVVHCRDVSFSVGSMQYPCHHHVKNLWLLVLFSRSLARSVVSTEEYRTKEARECLLYFVSGVS